MKLLWLLLLREFHGSCISDWRDPGWDYHVKRYVVICRYLKRLRKRQA